MGQPAHLDPTSFSFPGNKVGILLLHGFTGAPPEVRPMGEYLAKQGYTVLGPLLPGHGTTPEDQNSRTWTELVAAAREALEELQSKCDKVFVAGLSMGGLLTLRLGQVAPGIAGLIPMAAAVYVSDPLAHLLPVLRFVRKTWPKSGDPSEDLYDTSQADQLWHYDVNPVPAAHQLFKLIKAVRNDLAKIDQPILVIHGKEDRAVPLKAAYAIHDKVRSRDKELYLLNKSGHCLTVDGERQQVWERVHQWVEKRA